MLDLKYSKASRLCFWLLIVFTILTIAFEYFVYAFEQLAEDKGERNGNQTQSSLTGADSQYKDAAYYFILSREFSELSATVACYSLLILQFFTKKERKIK